jgi:hypothetical protein
MAATLADTIGETPLPSGPAPANSRPSSGNFPNGRRRRLSGNRLLLVIEGAAGANFPQSLPGTHLPLPALLVRKRYPSVQRGRVSSLPPDPPAGVCPYVQRGWPPPPAIPLPIESGSVCATWADPTSRILSRDVSVPVCATWAGTSSFSYPLIHPEDDSSVGGIDSSRDPLAPRVPRPAPRLTSRDPPAPRVLRLAFPLAPHDLRHALRPTLRPGVVFIPRKSHQPPTPLRLLYSI